MYYALTVSLVGGSNPWYGRVEIFHDGQWGTVCDDYFNRVDAQVVCRLVGYSGGRVSVSGTEGSGEIWLDNVDCNGNEASLGDCWHRGWGVHNCGHHEDVSVECGDFFFFHSLARNGFMVITRSKI